MINGLEGWRQENRTPAVGARGAGGARGTGAGPRQPSRFLRALMHDLAARMTWAVTLKYAGANRYPIVTLKNATLSGRPGEVVNLTVATKDPDGDKVSVKWWRFENNGTYAIALDTTEGQATGFRIPADANQATRVTSLPRPATTESCH